MRLSALDRLSGRYWKSPETARGQHRQFTPTGRVRPGAAGQTRPVNLRIAVSRLIGQARIYGANASLRGNPERLSDRRQTKFLGRFNRRTKLLAMVSEQVIKRWGCRRFYRFVSAFRLADHGACSTVY